MKCDNCDELMTIGDPSLNDNVTLVCKCGRQRSIPRAVFERLGKKYSYAGPPVPRMPSFFMEPNEILNMISDILHTALGVKIDNADWGESIIKPLHELIYERDKYKDLVDTLMNGRYDGK